MLSQTQVREVRTLLQRHLTPVLSLYLDVNPARVENAGKAYVNRSKAALKDLEVPHAISERVLQSFQTDLPQAKTRVIFAGEGWHDIYDLQIDLPLVDGIEAHWGESYLTPLLYALDEFERYGLVCVTQDKARMFELFMGEIEELPGAFRGLPTGEWHRMSSDSVGRRYTAGTMVASRARANTDAFEHRVDAWTHRYYKHLASLLEDVVHQRNITRLLVLGPERDVRAFEAVWPKYLRERLAAMLPALPSILVSAGEALKTVEGTLEGLELKREDKLLVRIAEEGLTGTDHVLQALQEGKLHEVVAPWHLDQTVYACPEGWVGTSPDIARAYCPDRQAEPIQLKAVLPELALAHGARLEFVRGHAEQRLLQEFGGMAGFPRY